MIERVSAWVLGSKRIHLFTSAFLQSMGPRLDIPWRALSYDTGSLAGVTESFTRAVNLNAACTILLYGMVKKKAPTRPRWMLSKTGIAADRRATVKAKPVDARRANIASRKSPPSSEGPRSL